ncbi:MAG: metallophosphoesterase [Chromatiaceae bacterium]|nr:MAG: metallophosphoesterase [Chromatiaceae bacterium]
MKLAVFSDIQANLPALEETIAQLEAWRPDLVVMAGDLINRGPDSGGCLARFQAQRERLGWLPVTGNHEEWVLRCGETPARTPGEQAVRQFADWAWHQVAPQADALRGWPDHLCLHPPGGAAWVHVTHGSMAGNRDGIGPGTSDNRLADRRLPEGVALFVTAHTHRPFQRRFQGIDLVNVGSAGSPFDGDPRASLGRFTWHRGRWHSEIIRFPYDRVRAEQDFHDSGFLELGALARLVFMEWQRANLLMAGWRQRYEQAVIDGLIDLEHTVTEYLDGLGLQLPAHRRRR